MKYELNFTIILNNLTYKLNIKSINNKMKNIIIISLRYGTTGLEPPLFTFCDLCGRIKTKVTIIKKKW